MWWWNGYGFGPWFFGPVMMIVAVLFIVFVVRAIARTPRERSEDRSLAILRERFARGEINQSQYEEQRRLLEA